MVLGVDPLVAVDRLLPAAADGSLDAVCDRLGVRLLGVFGSAARQHRSPSTGGDQRPPADLNIAVSFDGPPHLLELVDALVQMTDCDVLDVAVIDREALDDLAELRDVDAKRLAAEHLTRAAAERLIQDPGSR